ncbi:MAG: methyltransferase domain-containing protein [Alphaproteobacteria bacterium]|nr:methyltransferase domain-containing protein [Alphaproteobacteria bacterium]
MTLELVKAYYGQTLSGSADLRTDACSTLEPPPAAIADALGRIHEEVARHYYGCGLIAPPALSGLRILDLGCGAGRDCYLLSQLAGPEGEVVGIDATPAQLAIARRHQAWHAERFGHSRSNVSFIEGDVGRLDQIGLPPASFDLIVSNCVFNLLADKAAVFAEAHRLLKPGGELYFADVYADRRLPPRLMEDPVLLGECLAGALYWNDFLSLVRGAGFADPRLVSDRPIAVRDPVLKSQLGEARFFSATYRLFRLEGLEPACEDYGQAVRYRGGIAGAEEVFVLDAHHRMDRGRIFPVCGNSFRMIAETRFAPFFDLHGDMSTHFGIFPGCGTALPFGTFEAGPERPASGCC